MTDTTAVIPAHNSADADDKAEREIMEQYGIIREPASVYLVGPYRYSKLADALAGAKRMATTPWTTSS